MRSEVEFFNWCVKMNAFLNRNVEAREVRVSIAQNLKYHLMMTMITLL